MTTLWRSIPSLFLSLYVCDPSSWDLSCLFGANVQKCYRIIIIVVIESAFALIDARFFLELTN